jgi:hypothetical protein
VNSMELLKTLIEKNTITDLNISGSTVEDHGMEMIFKSLEKNNSLKKLNLSSFQKLTHLSIDNEIGPKCFEGISNFFKNNDSLEELNLNSTKFFSNPLESFTSSKNLKKLFLSSLNLFILILETNLLKSKHLINSFVKLIKENKSIVYLDISRKSINY